ncbi:cytochrome P450 [Iamia sp.]|uniref:cytochrome P450 n=1 Tax=Iamia sp. TaxID=2722710 RepID=UPI002C0C49BA|nr:cytochrome P450 [Iamia sp.]HXH59284.1 cytochrome P450 [Iamia sp.]
MNAFLENPDQYDLLASDPDRYIKGAVEEILRWATPVLYFRRNATQDFELRDHTISDGDKISMWYISANRDEDHFDDPFRFDITRDAPAPSRHRQNGRSGPGGELARNAFYPAAGADRLLERLSSTPRAGPRTSAPGWPPTARPMSGRRHHGPGGVPSGLSAAGERDGDRGG